MQWYFNRDYFSCYVGSGKLYRVLLNVCIIHAISADEIELKLIKTKAVRVKMLVFFINWQAGWLLPFILWNASSD